MFSSKKLLSLISILFVGSQSISTVRAAAADSLIGCESITEYAGTCDGAIDTDKYCILGNKIYQIAVADGCKTHGTQLGNGVYGFENDSTGGSLVFNNGIAGVTITDEDKLSLYQCIYDVPNGIVCTPTFGYFAVGNNYYTVGSNGNDKNDNSSSNAFDSASCNSKEDAGKLYDSSAPKLCIDGTNDVVFVESEGVITNYFVKNNAGNIFNNAGNDATNNKKYIIVQASKNAFTLVDRGYDYCAGSNEVAIETFKEICGNGNDDNPCGSSNPIFETVDGLITRSTSCRIKPNNEASNCHTGYYVLNVGVIDSDGYYELQAVDTDGTLYHCTDENACTVIGDYKKGYYKNKAATSATSTTDAYIKCDSTEDKCRVIATTATDCTNAGDIVFDSESGVYKLCLDKGEAVTPIDINAGVSDVKQFVSLDNANVFGVQKTGKYISVVAKNGNVVVETVADGEALASAKKYLYTNEKYEQKPKASVCVPEAVIVEFKKDSTSTIDSIIYEKKGTHKLPAASADDL